MTYMQFHLVFILPVIALLLFLNREHLRREGRKVGFGLLFLCTLALVYTTPWDNYLVKTGVWGYPVDRVVAVIGYVPVEEYLFFVLQPILTGLWLFWLIKRTGLPWVEIESRRPRFWGGLVYGLLTVAGVACLFFERALYFGLILTWASPIGLIQWVYGGEVLWRHARIFLAGLWVPTLYLWWADRSAIGRGIWEISERYTTGLELSGLPLEEALFFLVTNLMIVQGLMLFWFEWETGRVFRRFFLQMTAGSPRDLHLSR